MQMRAGLPIISMMFAWMRHEGDVHTRLSPVELQTDTVKDKPSMEQDAWTGGRVHSFAIQPNRFMSVSVMVAIFSFSEGKQNT